MTNWTDIAFLIFLTILFVLFCGEPDLMDAIVHCLMK